MNLQTTPVSRCLDNKLLILGFEVPDLLAIFLLLAILNFMFGRIGGWSVAFIWGAPLSLAALLRYGKRDKPDNYLLHVARYYLSPGVYSAFAESKSFHVPPKMRKS